jgi:hypothetical protein
VAGVLGVAHCPAQGRCRVDDVQEQEGGEEQIEGLSGSRVESVDRFACFKLLGDGMID